MDILNLSKRLNGRLLFENLSLSLPSGTLTVLKGANGVGKSTLLKTVAGLLRPDSGTLRLDGRDLAKDPAARRFLAYVPQEIALDERLTVGENMALFAALYPQSRAERARRLTAARQDPLVADFWEQPLRACSGGQRRRANLLAGLINDPQVLLLDEALAGADPAAVELILAKLLDLRAAGCAILAVSHQDRALEELADRVYALNEGQLLPVAEAGRA